MSLREARDYLKDLLQHDADEKDIVYRQALEEAIEALEDKIEMMEDDGK